MRFCCGIIGIDVALVYRNSHSRTEKPMDSQPQIRRLCRDFVVNCLAEGEPPLDMCMKCIHEMDNNVDPDSKSYIPFNIGPSPYMWCRIQVGSALVLQR